MDRAFFSGLTEQVVKESVAGAHSDSAFEFTEKEDGESASDWAVYDQSPAGASVSVVEDALRRSNVIFCDAPGEGGNGFAVGDRGDANYNVNGTAWNETKRVLSFWYKGGINSLYVCVSASDGDHFLIYKGMSGTNYVDGSGDVLFYLGTEINSSDWIRFERNVEADWESVAGTSWQNTDGILIRPDSTLTYDFYFDDIRLSNSMTVEYNTLKGGSIGQIAVQYTFVNGGYNDKTERWMHYDRLGNVMNRTNENGTTTDTFYQDAFGNVLSSITTGAWASSTSGRHLTTKEYDGDSGLYYFYQRWYDPQVGRFVSKTYLPPDKEHPYGYALNSPLLYVDPIGLAPVPGRYKACYSRYDKCMDDAPDAFQRGLCKCELAACKKGVDVACGQNPGNEQWCCYVDYIGCLNDCPQPPTQECTWKCQSAYLKCYMNAYK